MLAFSNDYYGLIFRATQSVELFCAYITLKGKWLEELEFHLWDYVQVKCENGQLIITPDVNKAQEQEAKTAFMDEEIKKLRIRYQNEKEEITAKYVAEQSAGCYGKKA